MTIPTVDQRTVNDGHHQYSKRGAVIDKKPALTGDPLAASGTEPTDEQLDAEAPGVDDAAELEAAEAEVAAEAAEDEDKVVPAPSRRRRGAITSEGRDDAAAPARAPRPARGVAARSTPADGGTR